MTINCIIHSVPAIYNVQVAFTKERNHGTEPTMTSILTRRPLIGDVFIQRIGIEEVDYSSDESLTNWLNQLYQKKVCNRINCMPITMTFDQDELMDYHQAERKFPGQVRSPPRRLVPAINFAFWTLVVVAILIKLMTINWIWFFSVVGLLFTSE